MSKNGIFGLYGVVSVIGAGCFAALIFSGQQIELQTAVLGFYGFLSTTALFYVMSQMKSESDDLQREIVDRETALWRHLDKVSDDLHGKLYNEIKDKNYCNNN